MAETTLTQQFDRFNLSARARRHVSEVFGSFEEVAKDIKRRETKHRDEQFGGGSYESGSARWAVEFCEWRRDENGRRRNEGIGPVTALEIIAATLVLGLVSFEDCFPSGPYVESNLKNRRVFNKKAEEFGWSGPFLPDRIAPAKADSIAKRSAVLDARRGRLLAEIEKIDAELKGLAA